MMQIVIERRIGRLTACHLAKFNKSPTFDHAGESPGEIPGNTSNVKPPPVVDVAQASEVLSDTGSCGIDYSADRRLHEIGIWV
jgi:hypothetical protein